MLCAACCVAVGVVLGLIEDLRERPGRMPVEAASAPQTSETAPALVVRPVPLPRASTTIAIARNSRAPLDEPELPDDASILATLHALAAADPPQSLRLARAALRRSPGGDRAPEFDWNVVKALYNMGRMDEAKTEAEDMVRAYPDTELSADVVRHLLNPQPNPE